MEKLHQQFDVIMNMSYRDLKKIVRIYIKFHPNKKKEEINRVNEIKANFTPESVGWKV